MFLTLLAVIAPVFVCAGIGFVWEKRRLPFDLDVITPLIVYIGTPALVVATLLRVDLSIQALSEAMVYALIAHAGFAALGMGVLALTRQPATSFLPALTFPNSGNLGLPLCLFAFGDEGLALAISYFVITSVGQFTVGVAISSGQWSPKRLVSSPLIWGVAVAIALIALDATLPLWVSNTLNLVAGLTIPLMLIGLGVSLARLRVGDLPLSTLFAVLRIAGGCAIGWGIAEVFALEGVLRGVVIVQSAMPAALFNYLFASFYQRRAEAVAGIVVISTTVAFLVMPAILWLAGAS